MVSDKKNMPPTPYRAIRKVILASMILLPFIPFILSVSTGYYYFTTALKTNTLASLERIVADHRQMIEFFLQERKADLEFIVQSYGLDDLSHPEFLKTVFARLRQKSDAFYDLGVFDANGLHLAYEGPYSLTGKRYQDAVWFQRVLQQGDYISDVFLGYRQTPHFIIALVGQDQGHKWVIRATIDTAAFNDLVGKVHIGDTGEVYILNREGILQTGRRSGGRLMEKPAELVRVPDPHPGIRTVINDSAGGKSYLYATTWLKDQDWVLVVRQEKADVFKQLHSATRLIVLIAAVGGAVIILVAFYLTRRIISRLEQADAEKDQLSQQLLRAARLAELGEMAAGFAHEINNPLQIMRSEQTLIEMLLAEMKAAGQLQATEPLAEIEDSIHQIQVQVLRCAEITQAILKFGRQSEPLLQRVDLGTFIPEIIKMVAKKAEVNGVALRLEISPQTPAIQGDPGQLQQVLINLFNNALYAIGVRCGASGGQLQVRAGANGNGQVQIEVTDNGCGISRENMKKIFAPFFTTKPVGQGTGLGLAVCFGIIDRMGGVMQADSREGAGTTLTIRLPAAV